VTSPPPRSLFDPLLSSDEVAAATGPEAWVEALVEFERELAAAQADLGILPAAAAEAVADACRTLTAAPADLGTRGRAAGNPAAPLVAALRPLAGEHGWAVHYGATSQDAMDTAMMLVVKRACAAVLVDLDRACDAAAALARRYRTEPMTGRTLLQPAVPVTFGLKSARWLLALLEAAEGVEHVAATRLAIQLGGAAGTLSAWGERGLELAARLAARLGLRDPVMPWHTDRSRLLEVSGALLLAAAAAAKVALDVVLLAQAEVGEVRESREPGHGSSSTMPHKANPVSSVLVLAGWRRAHGAASTLSSCAVQDHERAATGAWHAEWQSLTDLLQAVGGCVRGAADVLGSMSVDGTRLSGNLGASGALVLSERITLDLAPDIGRDAAAQVAATAAGAEGRTLREVLGSLPEVASRRSARELDALADPSGYLGAADALVERALHVYESRRHAGEEP